ncbi:MAG: cytochrome c peroxidase [Deltaproteobacteria bacterium]|nr:cytochrome c peroxidase [Deltaproteobacteria bacterium]
MRKKERQLKLTKWKGRGTAIPMLVSLALVLAGMPTVPGAAWSQIVIQQIIFDEPPPSLKTLPPPKPANLAEYVKDEEAAIRLGKALFWDMQVGSDGMMACASCHFKAGADPRSKNQLNPGMNGGDTAFGNSAVKGASGFKQFKPNYQLQTTDFPFHQRQNPERQASKITRDTNDVVSSQGVVLNKFEGVEAGRDVDLASPLSDQVFKVTSGKGRNATQTNVRRVEPVNAPSVINSVFNFANFVNGRANHFFNGQNPFGPADNTAGVWVNESGNIIYKPLNGQEGGLPVLDFSSVASQATGPPVSDLEMSWQGRTWAEIGKKMLSLEPLAKQLVDPDDSVLGPYSKDPGPGITLTSYADMIRAAFHAKFWDASQPTVATAGQRSPQTRQVIQLDTSNAPLKKPDKQDPRTFKLNSGKGQVKEVSAEQTLAADQFELMEANFALFFALSVQLYQTTLVSDDTPFDRFQDGDPGALSEAAQRGMQVFFLQGRCNQCHGGSLFTNAAVDVILGLNGLPLEGLVERMGVAQGEAFYDTGFYNIAVRPTAEDLGRGGTLPSILANPADNGNPYPLSFSRLGLLKQEGKLPPWYDPFVDPLPGNPGSLTRVAVDGAQKTPGLRNVELTGPYFRNGGAATLMQVVDFYTRGGNFPAANIDNLDPFIAEIPFLQGNEAAQQDLVAFMLALTDERVKYEKAPFDHPQLFVVNGHNDSTLADIVVEVPAVGANGRPSDDPLRPFLAPAGADSFIFHTTP